MHIVFHQEDAKTLLKSFELDDSLRQEIKVIEDDYSIGPTKEIDTEHGANNRIKWWMKVKGENAEDPGISATETDIKTIKIIKEQVISNPDEAIWIWVAANKRDVCGYYWLISQLSNYVGRVLVLHLNNLPFINEKGAIFYPEYLSQILPKEFLKAKKLARPVTASEFEIDSDEWIRLGNENKSVRLLEGAKKIAQFHGDYFDESLLNFMSSDWQKAGKLISQFSSKSKIEVDDAFIFSRIRSLIEDQTIEAQGDEKNKKEFEVKKIIFS